MRIALVACLLTSCAATPVPLPDYIDKLKWPEVQDNFPANADKVPLTDLNRLSMPIEVGMTATVAGILLSEAEAVRFYERKLELDQFRVVLREDRKEWVAQREAYELQIKEDARLIEDLRPDWWDERKFWIGAGTGVIGVIVTFLVLKD